MVSPDDSSHQAEAALIRRLQNCQDAASWQEFVDTYRPLICGHALMSGMTKEEAEEIAQETLLAVAKKMPTFTYDPSIGLFKTYLLSITRLRILARFKKRAMYDATISIPAENIVSRSIVSFLGRSVAVSGDTAYVTALNESTGERFEAECEASFLRERGIEEGAEFVCTVTRQGGQTIAEFAPLPPRVLSEEDLEKISNEVDSRLK